MNIPDQFRGHLAAAFTIFIWAITFVSIKILLGPFSPVEIMFYRMILALAALLVIRPPRLALPHLDAAWLRQEWLYMAAGLCGVTLYFTAQNTALVYTQAANVSVLVSVAPLFTALLSRAVLKEPLKANFLIGFLAAMVGIILIAFNGSFVLKLNPLGDVLSIGAALVWACYSVLIKVISRARQSLLSITRRVFFYGIIFMLPVLLVSEFRLGLERLLNLPNLFNLLFLGVGASALCFVTWNYAVSQLGPVRTSVYIYANPVVTIIFSAIFLKETITLVAIIGMTLILAGMAFSERDRSPAASGSDLKKSHRS